MLAARHHVSLSTGIDSKKERESDLISKNHRPGPHTGPGARKWDGHVGAADSRSGTALRLWVTLNPGESRPHGFMLS